jgi:cytoskeleton protein RodZ
MPTVGEQLRAAREQQKLTVHQVADATKIKTDHIRALEDSDWRAFTAPVYIRGFIRSYAACLKLDVSRVMQELAVELAQTKDFADHPSLTGSRKGPLDLIMLQLSRVKWQIVFPVIIVIAVALGLGYGIRAWKTQQKKDPLQGLGSGLHQPARSAAKNTLPVPTNAPPARR